MSNKLFTQVPVPKFPSSTFSLSRSVMFTPRLQKLYCPNVIETLPGDGINERSEQFARTQPMISPTFAKINADQHAFFVPFWQLNSHFDDFITGGEKGDYSYKLPYTNVANIMYRVYQLLSFNIASQSTFEGYITGGTVTVQQYNYILEKVQSIMEHCDLLRAVPFVVPDFVQMISTNPGSFFTANKAAFVGANPDYNSNIQLRVNYAPFIAYLKVWCEYFRDENLCEDYFDTIIKEGTYGTKKLFEETGLVALNDVIGSVTDWSDGEEVCAYADRFCALLGVLPRAWKKDYFTAALPFTQKGPEVLLPLSGVFPVNHFTDNPNLWTGEAVTASNADGPNGVRLYAANPAQEIKSEVRLSQTGLGSTIQDVRRAFRLEEFYEADGRGGNRYPENTLMQWGVHTPDSRLPRSIFLGSNMSPIQISEVVQTSSTAAQPTPQGTLAGKGVSYGNNRLSRYYYTMHGFLINLYSVRVHAVYEQGVHPMFSRFDRTEYAWPRFAHLGEQPVYTKELYVDSTVTENEVFGYEPRYSEYKSEKSSIHGALKGSLNFWTMSRRFANKPALNEEFIYNPPRLDNFAVVNPLIAPLVVEIDYRVRANRKLPFFGVPML